MYSPEATYEVYILLMVFLVRFLYILKASTTN
jgi:hypothetical protein